MEASEPGVLDHPDPRHIPAEESLQRTAHIVRKSHPASHWPDSKRIWSLLLLPSWKFVLCRGRDGKGGRSSARGGTIRNRPQLRRQGVTRKRVGKCLRGPCRVGVSGVCVRHSTVGTYRMSSRRSEVWREPSSTAHLKCPLGSGTLHQTSLLIPLKPGKRDSVIVPSR